MIFVRFRSGLKRNTAIFYRIEPSDTRQRIAVLHISQFLIIFVKTKQFNKLKIDIYH